MGLAEAVPDISTADTGGLAIRRLLGELHYSAVSKAAARLREAVAADRALGKIVRGLDSHFKA